MYLEISARQSRKTERLFDALHLTTLNDPGVSPIVYTTTGNYAKQLKERYQEKYGQTRVIQFRACTADAIVGTTGPYFFDEFDFIDLNWFVLIKPVQLLESYFVTTARRMRKLVDLVNVKTHDIMGKLLQMNEFSYENYPMIQQSNVTIKTQFENLPIDMFNLQVQGLFIQ